MTKSASLYLCTFSAALCEVLQHGEHYTIHAFTEAEFNDEEGEPESRWRVTWWDATHENFYDSLSGEMILMQDFYKLRVIPTPLPKVIS